MPVPWEALIPFGEPEASTSSGVHRIADHRPVPVN